MFNRSRKALLFLVVAVILASGYYLVANHRGSQNNQVKLRATAEGVDVVIENFKVTHQDAGRTDWELRAESASVNNKTKITSMKKVSGKMETSDEQSYRVSADTGTLQNETEDFLLEGHVKFLADVDAFEKRPQPNATH